jgi:hypothetical protein
MKRTVLSFFALCRSFDAVSLTFFLLPEGSSRAEVDEDPHNDQEHLPALVNAAAGAQDDLGDEVGERADVQMKKSKLASKLIRVPLEFIETVQETFDAPSFGNKQSHETWMACVEALHNSADDERVNELTAEVRELRLQLEKLSLRSVAATLERQENFRLVFGLSKDLFDIVLDVVKDELPGQGHVNVFSPHKDGTPGRAKPSSLPVEDIFGAFCRRICKFEQFSSIGSGLGKSDEWARRLCKATVENLAKNDSSFSKRFLTPEMPKTTWEFIKENRQDVVDFLEENVDNFDPLKVYYVVLIDGVHFESLEVHDFLLHSLSRSEKKQSCTLLSIVATTLTDQACFISDFFGGKTAEQTIVASTNFLRSIYDFVKQNGGDEVVFFVDKGFRCVDDFAKSKADCHCFIPFRKVANKQLTKLQANLVRQIAWIRQQIEYHFGQEKRLCKISARGNLKLGASFSNLHSYGQFLSSVLIVCFGVQNASAELRRTNRYGFGSQERFEEISSFLPSKFSASDIKVPKVVPVPGSMRKILADIPQYSEEIIGKIFSGHFRDANIEHPISTTNLLAKASKLLVGHHVLGMRMKRDETSLWFVFVIIASYRRGVYHACLRVNAADGSIADSYCSCFVGMGQCIHKAGGVLTLARYRKVNISEFRGGDGLVLSSVRELDIVSRDELRDKLSWSHLCDWYQNSKVKIVVHPEQLEEQTFDDVVAKVQEMRVYRYRRLGKAGEQSFGDELEKMKEAELKEKGEEEYAIDWTATVAAAKRLVSQ